MAGNAPSVAPVESVEELATYLESGNKPIEQWRIGTEHEKFCFRLSDLKRIPYDGPDGIRIVLEKLQQQLDWIPEFEGENIIALKDADSGGSVSLEPGGQLELSGAALETVHQTCSEVNNHLDEVRKIGQELGVGFLGLGFAPKGTRDSVPRMPKGRYDIMSNYMPKVGGLGLDMMYRSCTVQVNLDFSSEADMVKKLRVSLALQPIATAIFANSPFTEGKPNGFLSYRSEVWRDTDNNRTGMLPFAFEDGMGFERYVDYALQVPMYFIYRDGQYLDATGSCFNDFMEGKLDILPGEKPTLADWENHLTTLFPEVRIKRYMEMRGADGGPWKRLCALPALWVGLLYDQASLDGAWDLVKNWSAETRQSLRDSVPKTGLATPLGEGTAGDVARDMVALSVAGLNRRAKLNSFGDSEAIYLDTVEDTVATGKSPAEDLLERFHGPWDGNIDLVFKEEAY